MRFNGATYCIRKIVTSQFTLLIFVLVVWMDANRMCVLYVCVIERRRDSFSCFFAFASIYTQSHTTKCSLSLLRNMHANLSLFQYFPLFDSTALEIRSISQMNEHEKIKLRHDSRQVYWTCCSNSKEFNTKAMFSIYRYQQWYYWNQQHTKKFLHLSL